MRSANRIPVVSDEAFQRWKERVAFNEQKKLDRLKREAGDDLDGVVKQFIERLDIDPSKIVRDPAAPDGRCERCSEPFTRTTSGRLADHTCPDIVPPTEEQKEKASRDAALSLERPRRVSGGFGYDEDDDD